VSAQTFLAQTSNTHNKLKRVCDKQALLDETNEKKLKALNETSNKLAQIIARHQEELGLAKLQLQQQGQTISRDARQGLVLLQREMLERHAQSELHRESLARNLDSVLGFAARVVALEDKLETMTRASSTDGQRSIPIDQSANAPPRVVADDIDGTQGPESGGNGSHAAAPSSPPLPASAVPMDVQPTASVDGSSAFVQLLAAKRPAEQLPAAPEAKQPRAALSQQAHRPEPDLLTSVEVVPDAATAAAAAQPSFTLTTPSSPTLATATFAEPAQAPTKAAERSIRHVATAAETTASTTAASGGELSPTRPTGTEASNGAPAASTPPSTDDTIAPAATCTQLGRAAKPGQPQEALADLTIAQQAPQNPPQMSQAPTKLITIEELTHTFITDPVQVCACVCTQRWVYTRSTSWSDVEYGGATTGAGRKQGGTHRC
jgi:hypothetical protein